MESSSTQVNRVFNGLADHYYYSNTSVLPHLYYNRLSSFSPDTVFMITSADMMYLSYCVEGFLYGKISFSCTLTCTLLKKVQLFPGLGIYSGIFVIYLHCVLSKESRTTSIVLYALCLLYVLSTATIVSDLLGYIIDVSNNSICKYIFFFISYAVAYQYTTGSTSS